MRGVGSRWKAEKMAIKVRTALEHELNTARRIGVLMAGMSTKTRARVLALVQEHVAEEADGGSKNGQLDVRQLDAGF